MTHSTGLPHRASIETLLTRYRRREAITILTAYDHAIASLIDDACDAVLVGDSLGMTVFGRPDTLAVTMDEVLHHVRAVRPAIRHALLIADLPFMSYQVGADDALRNAGRLVQDGGAQAVKLEGGRELGATVGALVRAGIPVQGHLGLTPQRLNALGGWRVQGRDARTALTLMDDALALQDAGCFSIVLECIPARVATRVTEVLDIPTIGIGAGSGTSGQVLVVNDALGLSGDFRPKFVKPFADLGHQIRTAAAEYRDAVVSGRFPAIEHTFEMPDDEWDAFLRAAGPALGAGQGQEPRR